MKGYITFILYFHIDKYKSSSYGQQTARQHTGLTTPVNFLQQMIIFQQNTV